MGTTYLVMVMELVYRYEFLAGGKMVKI